MGLLLFVLVGCSISDDESDQGIRAEPTPILKEEPRGRPSTFSPLDADELRGGSWSPLQDLVSYADVLRASKADASARSGELFAVLVAQYFTEARGEKIEPNRLASLVPDNETLRRYAWEEQNLHVAIESDRHIDPHVSPWIRSRATRKGDVTRVSTQLNAYVHGRLEGQDASLWVRFRLDVAHRDGRWLVEEYVNATASRAKEPSRSDLKDFFDKGKGWRKIPPA